MKYKLHNFFQNGNLFKGFTLVELMLVFAVTGIITALGVTSFGSYNTTQQFGTSVSEFTNFVSTTRSKAISQVKPPVGSSAPLDGYKVPITD